MAGLEFRGNVDGNIPVPAIDVPATTAYFATAKANDPVVMNASGEIVRATATDAVLYGVLAAREYMRSTELPKIVKVRTSRSAAYEVKIAAGTPVVGTAYNLNAAGELDATLTTAASVKVVKILENITPKAGTEKTALVTLV